MDRFGHNTSTVIDEAYSNAENALYAKMGLFLGDGKAGCGVGDVNAIGGAVTDRDGEQGNCVGGLGGGQGEMSRLVRVGGDTGINADGGEYRNEGGRGGRNLRGDRQVETVGIARVGEIGADRQRIV